MFLKIRNFDARKYLTSSSDLIAVKYEIKKVTRLECQDLEEFKKIKNSLEKESLKVVCSKEELFSKLNIYISKSEELAKEARKLDPSYKIINQKAEFSGIINDIYRFSELLSYPECCIKKYINNIEKNINVLSCNSLLNLPKKIDFHFNNILNGISNHYLSFHFPCSFNCKNSLEYLKRILNSIEKECLDFAKEIKNYLKRPFIIFLNPNFSNVYASWDNRIGFIFDGYVEKNTLKYSDVIFIKTCYPDIKNNKNHSFIRDNIDNIKKGNKIIFEENSFSIYKNDSFISKFENNANIEAFLFNFV